MTLLLHRVDGPFGDARRRGDKRHGKRLATQQLREDAPEVVVIIVEEDEPVARGRPPSRRSSGVNTSASSATGTPFGCHRPAPSTRPRPGGNGDVLEVVGGDLLGGDPTLECHLDVREPLDLGARGSRGRESRRRGRAAVPRARRAPRAIALLRPERRRSRACRAPEQPRARQALRPRRGPSHRLLGRGSARDAIPVSIPRPWSGSECSGSGSWSRRPRRRYCSRCTRGCPRSALPRSCSGGRGRRSKGGRLRSRSRTPSRTIRAIVSGEVKRPTPTTGLLVTA